MSMREQMARAMYARDRGPRQTVTWEELAESIRDRYWGYVDAALGALLQPTDGMLSATLAVTGTTDAAKRLDECAIGLIAYQDMMRAAKDGK